MDTGSGDFSARTRNPPLYTSISFQCYYRPLRRKRACEGQPKSEFVWACFGESDGTVYRLSRIIINLGP